MHLDVQACWKFKRVCTDIPNQTKITKSATTRYIQVTYAHASVGNKSPGKMVTTFPLAGSLQTPTAVSIDIKRAFSGDGEKILFLTTLVLFGAAAGNLAKSKKLRDGTSRNAIIFPPFLTKTVVTDSETVEEVVLKIFAERIKDQETDNTIEELDADKNSGFNKDNEKEKAKIRSSKYATTRDAAVVIADDCNDVLTFF